MGITKNDLRFILFAIQKESVSLKNTLMLGRLELYVTNEEIELLASQFNYDSPHNRFTHGYAEPLFKFLGAEKVNSLDYSNYEGAGIIHDLNQPIGEDLYEISTCVVDSGTLEHVFNFPVAMKNAMKMIVNGGHYVGITPANNQLGHGFYQFSPELYYRVFSEENGFQIKRMFITSLEKDADWYEVADPKHVGNRGTITNNKPLCLMVLAQKIKNIEPFSTHPIQSDYASTWLKIESLSSGSPLQESILKFHYRKWTPKWTKRIIRNVYDLLFKETITSPDLGITDSVHFRKFDPNV